MESPFLEVVRKCVDVVLGDSSVVDVAVLGEGLDLVRSFPTLTILWFYFL